MRRNHPDSRSLTSHVTLQLGPEDRRWRPAPGVSHVFPGAPLGQQRHDHLPLPVRWVQLCAGGSSVYL